MSFPRYESYRDSGVDWIGEIPAHWQMRRLRSLVEIKKRIAGVEGPEVLSITQRGIKVRDIDSNDGQLAETYAHYQIVEAGDFAMNHMDLLTGWVDLAKQDGVTSPDYRVFTLRPGSDSNPNYLLRILQNGYSSRIFYAFGQGASHFGRWRLPTDAFQDFVVPLPPLHEQVDIANFLNRETTKIEALVEGQRQLIKLLKEKRQALISQAVTKGLNPLAPMRDSGIEWLGDVPAHWEIFVLKREIEFLTSGSRGWASHYSDDGALFIRIGNLTRDRLDLDLTDIQRVSVPPGLEGERTRVRTDDILFSITAYLGSVAVVPPSLDTAYVSQHVALARLSGKRLLPRWAALVASSLVGRTYLDMQGYGGTKIQLALDDVAGMLMVVPPLAEQMAILADMERQIRSLDQLVLEAQDIVDLLHERRAALIAAAVTGKIDVPAASPLDVPKLDRGRLRLIVGAHIVEALAKKPSAGRTKAHKIVYLTQAHAGVHELGGAYVRHIAGPLDAQLIDEMEGAFKRTGCISVEQPGGRGSQVLYTILGEGCGLQSEFHEALGSRAEAVDKLITDLADFDVHAVEAITTLYAVWNDFLLDGPAPTDDKIIRAFLENWHPKKAENFRRSELYTWLSWMRGHGLVPQGSGPRTTIGRLFA